MRRYLLALIPLTMALMLTAQAGHCIYPSQSQATFENSGFYFIVAECPLNCCVSNISPQTCDPWETGVLWIYEETNNILGLQRFDWVVDNTCHLAYPPDEQVIESAIGNILTAFDLD